MLCVLYWLNDEVVQRSKVLKKNKSLSCLWVMKTGLGWWSEAWKRRYIYGFMIAYVVDLVVISIGFLNRDRIILWRFNCLPRSCPRQKKNGLFLRNNNNSIIKNKALSEVVKIFIVGLNYNYTTSISKMPLFSTLFNLDKEVYLFYITIYIWGASNWHTFCHHRSPPAWWDRIDRDGHYWVQGNQRVRTYLFCCDFEIISYL